MKDVQTNIYIDSNVLIDYFDTPQFGTYIKFLYDISNEKYTNLYVSALSIAQFVAKYQKRKANTERVKKFVNEFLTKMYVVPFEESAISQSMQMQNTDLEDNMQYVQGIKYKCKYFVTSNISHYKDYLNIIPIKPSQVFSIKHEKK
jgi:predicted nucleic acid-binding protein